MPMLPSNGSAGKITPFAANGGIKASLRPESNHSENPEAKLKPPNTGGEKYAYKA